MTVRISILCENSVGRPIPALGEHGFACLIETPAAGTWLLDTGRGKTLLGNMDVLGHDPHEISGVILSHGHNDHAGGLRPLLEQIGPRPVYAHRGAFIRRYWQGLHERRDISIPWSQAELEICGADFKWVDGCEAVAEDLLVSGPISRHHPAETGDPHLVCTAGDETGYQADPFHDDLAVAVKTPRGLIILLGCAHAGLINSVEFFRQTFPGEPIHAIIGGTHLGPASEEQFKATIDYLDNLHFDRLGVSHCTGPIRSAQLYSRYPNKVFFANVGTTMEIDVRS